MATFLGVLFIIVNFLWGLAGILFFVAIVLAFLGTVGWSAVVGWLVITLALSLVRMIVAYLAASADERTARSTWEIGHLVEASFGRVTVGVACSFVNGVIMRRVTLLVAVALSWMIGLGNVAIAQDDRTLFELISSIVNDTTCEDAVGRTLRSDTLFSAARNDDADRFFARHESCAGMGRAAEVGLVPIPLGLVAQCSGPVVIPSLDYEWVICNLTFIPKSVLTSPITVHLSEFGLATQDEFKLASYTYPDLYQGQMRDMSAGLVVAGPEPSSGVVAFPVYPGRLKPPFLLVWERSGDFIIADELEPTVAEHFIRDFQS
jgi:hypothetical protein